jgi:hypothetical protein
LLKATLRKLLQEGIYKVSNKADIEGVRAVKNFYVFVVEFYYGS